MAAFVSGRCHTLDCRTCDGSVETVKKTKVSDGAVTSPDMYRCTKPGCRWQAVAASAEAAFDQYVDHLLDEHTEVVAADIPEGMVQVQVGDDDEWRTVTRAEARRIHREEHGDE